jgi:hypothetical protein
MLESTKTDGRPHCSPDSNTARVTHASPILRWDPKKDVVVERMNPALLNCSKVDGECASVMNAKKLDTSWNWVLGRRQNVATAGTRCDCELKTRSCGQLKILRTSLKGSTLSSLSCHFPRPRCGWCGLWSRKRHGCRQMKTQRSG